MFRFALLSAFFIQSIRTAFTPVPLLAFSYPQPFPGLETGFTTSFTSPIVFLPQSLHPCGSLLVLSAPGLLYSDFESLSTTIDSSLRSGKIKNYFDLAEDRVKENDADELGVLEWAKGWKATCSSDVRVAKIDGVLNRGEDRESSIIELDRQISVHLDSLPKLPQNSLVILTILSPKALLQMFDIVSSSPIIPAKEPLNSSKLAGVPRRSAKNILNSFISALFKISFEVAVLGVVVYLTAKWWRKKQLLKRHGRVMLLKNDEELDLHLDAE